jgi:hypothetical protein
MFQSAAKYLPKNLCTAGPLVEAGRFGSYAHRFPQNVGNPGARLHNPSTGLSTGKVVNKHSDVQHGYTPVKRAKRPSAGTRRPLLIHSPEHDLGGTVKKLTNGLAAAAVTHLRLLRSETGRQDQTYVLLAYGYGLTVPEIAEASNLSVERVRFLLVGNQ